MGDLLSLTADGGYDYFFNIHVSADHPINAGRTPEGFHPLPLRTQDTLTLEGMHKPATLISNVNVEKTRLQAGVTVLVP